MGIYRFKDYDLNLLVTLHVLLEERNVTRAAKRLGVTQSAASRSLARLREQLGDEILVRARGQMVPTPRAEAMEAPLKRVLHEIGVMLFTLEEIDPATLERSFRLGMSDYPMVPVLPALVERLAQEAPHVRFDVRPLPSDIDAPLVEGELDLVVCPRQPSTVGIVWSLLARDRFVTVCRAGHPRLEHAMDLEAYLRERHLMVAPDGETRVGPVD
ncbi:MAG: LysR family transcriptional regulator, partial [Myxococcota bacterium]